MSQSNQVVVNDKLTVERILRLHQAGGLLYTVPAYPPKDLLVDSEDAQHLAALWDNFNQAKKALDLKIEQLSR